MKSNRHNRKVLNIQFPIMFESAVLTASDGIVASFPVPPASLWQKVCASFQLSDCWKNLKHCDSTCVYPFEQFIGGGGAGVDAGSKVQEVFASLSLLHRG